MAQSELDAIDRRILEVLQRNARIPNTDLADEVGLTPAPDYPGSSDVAVSYRGMSVRPGMSPDEIVLVTGE